MIARTQIRWCSVSVFMFLGAVGTVATDTPEQVTRKLAGSNAREWVFKKWKTFLGAGDRCQQGESYRFTAQHQGPAPMVTFIKRLRIGRLIRTTRWTRS